MKYNAWVESLDFSSASAIATINAWCARNTENRLVDIMDEISPEARLILINALYFKGKGLIHSSKESNKNDFFTNHRWRSKLNGRYDVSRRKFSLYEQ